MIAEGIGKAVVVQVKKFPQIVLPMRPFTLHGT